MTVFKRRMFRKGKEVKKISNGEFEITLFVTNTGKTVIDGMQVLDKVPVNYQHGRYTINPEVESAKDQVLLRWKLPNLPPKGQWEVVYHIWGIGEFGLEEAKFV